MKCLTRKFVCLSDKDQQEVPECEEMRELLIHGLGEVKVTITEKKMKRLLETSWLKHFLSLKTVVGLNLCTLSVEKRIFLSFLQGQMVSQ